MKRHDSPVTRAARCLAAAGLAALLAAAATGTPAFAQSCGNDGSGFESWLSAFRQRGVRAGIAAGTVESVTRGLAYDRNVIRLDRGQRSFKLDFETFYARRAGPGLIRRGRQLMAANAALLSQLERTYGVPGAVIITIWGLETNYARGSGGKFPIPQALATLAYDCRRSAFFENELVNALRIIDRGDKAQAQMVGGWAGEIGPMQFLPSSYVKYAVDHDRDGRRDLFNSIPDMLASTANYLKQKGWRAGQPWDEGTANFAVIREWNKAEVYVKTIAKASREMAGG